MSSEIKHFIKTPIYVISCIVASLRQYFGTEKRISTEFSKYFWQEDQAISDIYIAEEFNHGREVVGKRPSAIVSFSEIGFNKDAMGDFMGQSESGNEVRKLSRVSGAIRIRCISENALSSVELATEIRYFIDTFRDQIQCAHKLDLLRCRSISGPARIEEYKEYWTTELICDISYQENWSVMMESLRIKSVDISMSPK
jgi:hypothetical protein